MLFAACVAKSAPPEASKQEKRELVVGISATFNPYCYLDAKGEPVGFDVEFLTAVEKKIPGIQFKFEPMEFNSLVVALEAGQIDLISHQMGKNPERAAKFTYPEESYIHSVISIVVGETTNGIESLDDLRGRTVALYATSAASQQVQNYNKEHADNPIKIIFTETEGILLVAAGTADSTITQPASVLKFQQEQGLKVKVVGKPVNETPVYQIFRKDDSLAPIITEFDRATRELREDGTIGRLSQEILGGDFT
jgi:L-cystine transport system substrate-binding protein